MITFETSGSFPKLEAFLAKMSKDDIFRALDRYGRLGVMALSAYTPADTGLTSTLWRHEVKRTKGAYSITWTNGNVVGGTPLVIMLQYGHGTGTGGYVQGRDFINPAMRPVFEQIADEVWRAVTSA